MKRLVLFIFEIIVGLSIFISTLERPMVEVVAEELPVEEKCFGFYLTDSELDRIYLVMVGEALSEGNKGMLKVASVVYNRLYTGGFYGETLEDVLRPSQFSILLFYTYDELEKFDKVNMPDFQRDYLKDEIRSIFCLGSPITHANHYHTVDIKPYWADPNTVVSQYQNHIFYYF